MDSEHVVEIITFKSSGVTTIRFSDNYVVYKENLQKKVGIYYKQDNL